MIITYGPPCISPAENRSPLTKSLTIFSHYFTTKLTSIKLSSEVIIQFLTIQQFTLRKLLNKLITIIQSYSVPIFEHVGRGSLYPGVDKKWQAKKKKHIFLDLSNLSPENVYQKYVFRQ